MDTIKRLEKWFFNHCDNDWEHDNKIAIYNLDNPGWRVDIDLAGTLLAGIDFDPIEYGDSEDRDATWIKCVKKDTTYIGLGSYNMLDSILNVFLDWADEKTDTSPWDELVLCLTSEIKHLSKETSEDVVDRLRKIYNEINDIPMEHPQKRDLLNLFDNFWQSQWK